MDIMYTLTRMFVIIGSAIITVNNILITKYEYEIFYYTDIWYK